MLKPIFNKLIFLSLICIQYYIILWALFRFDVFDKVHWEYVFNLWSQKLFLASSIFIFFNCIVFSAPIIIIKLWKVWNNFNVFDKILESVKNFSVNVFRNFLELFKKGNDNIIKQNENSSDKNKDEIIKSVEIPVGVKYKQKVIRDSGLDSNKSTAIPPAKKKISVDTTVGLNTTETIEPDKIIKKTDKVNKELEKIKSEVNTKVKSNFEDVIGKIKTQTPVDVKKKVKVKEVKVVNDKVIKLAKNSKLNLNWYQGLDGEIIATAKNKVVFLNLIDIKGNWIHEEKITPLQENPQWSKAGSMIDSPIFNSGKYIRRFNRKYKDISFQILLLTDSGASIILHSQLAHDVSKIYKTDIHIEKIEDVEKFLKTFEDASKKDPSAEIKKWATENKLALI
ncbi:MAG: hypothetical protein JJV93_01135 [Alphaproteobacteria bacterium]|nr:hypothetical protein [Alphaproteobacteria bacterium]